MVAQSATYYARVDTCDDRSYDHKPKKVARVRVSPAPSNAVGATY